MIDPVLFIHILALTVAVLGGLGSRTFLTSLVTGLFTGLLHAGLIALVGAQAGKFEVAEQPYLNLATDYAMNTGYLNFPNARYVTYLVVCGLALLLVTVAAWIVRFILCSIVCAVMPRREKVVEPAAPAAPAMSAPPASPPSAPMPPAPPAPAPAQDASLQASATPDAPTEDAPMRITPMPDTPAKPTTET